VPSLPAGNYEVILNVVVANWNNGSPAGLAIGGTGVTEIGNELPGTTHLFYPTSNLGQDPIDIQIASSRMGPAASGGSDYLLDPNGDPVSLLTGPPGALIPVGSAPWFLNDGNSFPLQIKLDPVNQIELTIHDGAAVSVSHLRTRWMKLIEVAPIVQPPPPPFRIIDGTFDAQGDLTITWESEPGASYTVQTLLDLNGTWADVIPNVPGTGATTSWRDGDRNFSDPNQASATVPRKFYRVRKN